ncbi:hypothetical protein [Azospirillum sp. TSH64]|uniref:hypothetical protein n=1 Tax=Azospirillum sp. TSH64 TaxID=652740 RepID=UPI0013048E8C|nr:hypothetical protein [Azospirillum sp. TSH64]
MVTVFHHLEGEMAWVLNAMQPEPDGRGLSAATLMWGLFMRTSACRDQTLNI